MKSFQRRFEQVLLIGQKPGRKDEEKQLLQANENELPEPSFKYLLGSSYNQGRSKPYTPERVYALFRPKRLFLSIRIGAALLRSLLRRLSSIRNPEGLSDYILLEFKFHLG